MAVKTATVKRSNRPYTRESEHPGNFRVYSAKHRLVGFVDEQVFTSYPKGKPVERRFFLTRAKATSWKMDSKTRFETKDEAVKFLLKGNRA